MNKNNSNQDLNHFRFKKTELFTRSYLWLDLLEAMTKRELAVRYKRTELGFLWIVITPVFQMLVIGLIFQHLLSNAIQNYFVYLLSGLLVWNYFSQTVLKNTQAIVNERHMIKKSQFPREIVILSISIAHYIHLLIGLFLLLIVTYVSGIQLNGIHLLVGMVLLFVITIGISLLTSAINVRFRDTSFAVSIILQLLFYSTPIIYSINQLPIKIKNLVMANPLSYVFGLFQSSFSGNDQNIPLLNTIAAICICFLLLLLGVIVFKARSVNFDDWL